MNEYEGDGLAVVLFVDTAAPLIADVVALNDWLAPNECFDVPAVNDWLQLNESVVVVPGTLELGAAAVTGLLATLVAVATDDDAPVRPSAVPVFSLLTDGSTNPADAD